MPMKAKLGFFKNFFENCWIVDYHNREFNFQNTTIIIYILWLFVILY